MSFYCRVGQFGIGTSVQGQKYIAERQSSTRDRQHSSRKGDAKVEELMQSLRGSVGVSVRQREQQFSKSISKLGRLTGRVTQFQGRTWSSHRCPALGAVQSPVGFVHPGVGFA